MKSNFSGKTKRRILYFFSIVFLIFIIIGFFNILFIAFDVNANSIADWFTGKKELKIKVYNVDNVTLDVKCTAYFQNYNNSTIPLNKINSIYQDTGYTYVFPYFDANKITNINIDARYQNYTLYAQKRYTFSETIQDLTLVIDNKNIIHIIGNEK